MISAPVEQIVKEMKSHPFTLLTVLGLICFAIWGWSAYARASDVSEVKTQVETNGGKIDRVLKLQLAEAIRGMQRQICGTADEAIRDQLRVTLDSLQQDYSDINEGTRYPVTRCNT